MNLDKILIKLEKQGWKLEKDFLDKNQNFLQDLVDETEKAINYTRCCKSDSDQLFCDCYIKYPRGNGDCRRCGLPAKP